MGSENGGATAWLHPSQFSNRPFRGLDRRVHPVLLEAANSNRTGLETRGNAQAKALDALADRLAIGDGWSTDVGGDIEFADEVTLGRAFGNRQKLES